MKSKNKLAQKLTTFSIILGLLVLLLSAVQAQDKELIQGEVSVQETGNLKAGAVQKNSLGMEFAYIPSGTFMMGDENGVSDEKPIHRVTISKGYFIGIYEVTQEQWEKVMGNNPSSFKNCGQCPVEQVSWEDVQEFIEKLNSQTNDGTTYRLPTEAEWEYAARAGKTGKYAGDLDTMAWYKSNSSSATHPVGQKSANAWGLYDMFGNVNEWVEDWYGKYPDDAAIDPTGAESGYVRVFRGGGWDDMAPYLRSACRISFSPGIRSDGLGFRLVRTNNN